MTPEEAVEILEGFIEANEAALDNSYHSAVMEEQVRKNIEAFRMAVEALTDGEIEK